MSNNSNIEKKIRKITILPEVRNLPFLTKLEKKIASEITRFTTQGKWFYKSLDTFSKELESTPKSVKKTYYKLKSNGFMETKKDSVDRRVFNYKMTNLFFDKISEFELESDEEFATFNPPKSNRKVTDNHPKSNQDVTEKYKNTPAPSSVEATNQLSNILNNECIKDLRNERENKEKIIDNQVPKQDLNNQERLNINSLSNFFGFTQNEKEDMDIFRSLNTLVLFLSGKGLVIKDLEDIRANLKQEEFTKNRFSKKHWGGWINDYQAKKTEEKIKEFTITKDPNYGKTGISYSYYLHHWNKGEMPEETTQEFLSNYFFN